MASLGQSSPSTRTRDSDLPDPCNEKRELRRMVQELEAENERLRRKLKYILRRTSESGTAFAKIDIIAAAKSALDGGGDQS